MGHSCRECTSLVLFRTEQQSLEMAGMQRRMCACILLMVVCKHLCAVMLFNDA
jgi:hypothetical protein